jgi:hypothetical protein
MLVYQLPTTAGQFGRTTSETYPRLMAAPDGRSSKEMVVWQYAPADSRAVPSGGVAKVVAAGKWIWSHQRRRGV